jgi:subtilisin
LAGWCVGATMERMHRLPAALFLAVLVALPTVAPVSAARPTPSPAIEPSAPPPTPEASDVPDATPAPDPTAAPDLAPTVEPSASPAAGPAADPAADAHGRPDTTGRYIVILRKDANTAAVVAKVRKHHGVRADRSFARAVRGFTAKLDAGQRRDVQADPDVVAVVPDSIVELTADIVPTGVSRVGGRTTYAGRVNPVSASSETEVDADVAIIDTGIAYHPDLNVAGGYNCSTSDRSAWRDRNGHGTHVAGTVGAEDNGFGVIGVAPGARVWAVKILNDDGYGLLSWYICGLDWILAQHDPVDSSRPLFEAVNMSVTKYGYDDRNCGNSNDDPLHMAICRVVGGGITVVAAAANDSHNAYQNIPASYDEVITVSALADTDGKPGGLGGNKCFSWGSYDKDDTFANFSNYGADVDIIAPGKFIYSTFPGSSYGFLSGTSMAAPTVTGAVALYKASRPDARPAEVREALRYLGNLRWATSTDPDPYHEPLLDVSRIGVLGTFDIAPVGSTPTRIERGTSVFVPVQVTRSPTFFERVRLTITSLPTGWTGAASPSSLMGWTANRGVLVLSIPSDTPLGTYQIDVKGTNQGRTETTTVPVEIVEDTPTAYAPRAGFVYGTRVGTTTAPVWVTWPKGTDPTSPIGGYEAQISRDGGPWGGTVALSAGQLVAKFTLDVATPYAFRVRTRDTAGNWSPWVVGGLRTTVTPVDDRSRSISYSSSWARRSYTYALNRTLTTSSHNGARARLTFTGHGIAVVMPRYRTYGLADVYIDGLWVRRVHLPSRAGGSKWVVFSRWYSTNGTHTIELRVHGSSPVPLDAFVVAR